MRTIDEIKAQIKDVRAANCFSPGVRDVCMDYLDTELRGVMTASIPLSRLEQLCQAEREQRADILPYAPGTVLHQDEPGEKPGQYDVRFTGRVLYEMKSVEETKWYALDELVHDFGKLPHDRAAAKAPALDGKGAGE